MSAPARPAAAAANGVTTCGTPAAYASDAVPIPP
ncbi:Uncharacterised protein [Burkholderia pseudomallei]|nr:Uncharacterised protein [Burkholderia pseudomallei]